MENRMIILVNIEMLLSREEMDMVDSMLETSLA